MNPEIVSYGDISRLSQVMKKAKAGLPVRLGAIGGSITAGAVATTIANRWLNLVAAWIQSTYGCPVTIFNGGISGTASPYGALRVQRDVIDHNVDICFVDCAVNNSPNDYPSYDSLIRKLMSASPQIAVVPVMFCDNSLSTNESSLIPVAQHYGCPIVSYVDGVTAAIQAGTITQAQISSPDGVHPPDFGHALAAQYIEELLAYAASLVAQAPFTSLYPNSFDVTTLYSDGDLASATLSGFVYAPDPGDNPNVNVGALISSKVWDTFTIPIQVGPVGNVWLQIAASNNNTAGTVLTQIDGINYNVTDCNNPALSPNAQELVLVATGVSPGTHTLKITNWPSSSNSGPYLWIGGIGTA